MQPTDDKQKQFMEIYTPIHKDFVRFCEAQARNITNHEDLINESILKVYQAWDSIQKKDALLFFLFRTAKHVLLNIIRKKKELGMENANELSYQQSNTAEADLEIQHLYNQLDKLTDAKREALIMFEISGYSIKEIAKHQDAKEGAVKVMLGRARKELKVLLEDEPRTDVKSKAAIKCRI